MANFDKAVAAEINQALTDLPAKVVTLSELVGETKEAIDQAIEKGYSAHEIAKVMQAKGVKITEASLRTYLSRQKSSKQ